MFADAAAAVEAFLTQGQRSSRSNTPANPLLRLPYTTRLHHSPEKVTK